MNIAIIGAGLSGTYTYSLLKKQNHTITIFEKSRGTGGRCSTKYVDDKFIDHGTPFFYTRDDSFKSFAKKQISLVNEDNSFFPINGMNKLCSNLIDKKDLQSNTKIVACKQVSGKWQLTDENNNLYENFDKLIITIPAPQVLQMDITLSNEIVDKLNSVTYNSIATLIVYSNNLQNIMHPKLLDNTHFKTIIDNSSKYDYKNFSSYVLHLDETITNKQNFQNKNEVENYILELVKDDTSINLKEDFHIIPHLWRYGLVANSIEENYLIDNTNNIGICGDYFNYKNLESSFHSSKKIVEAMF